MGRRGGLRYVDMTNMVAFNRIEESALFEKYFRELCIMAASPFGDEEGASPM